MSSHPAKIAAILFSFLVAQVLAAADVYVSPTGSDSNTGRSRAEPVKTFLRAQALIGPGDTCWLMDGVFRETLVVEKSGTPEAPITFAAAPGADVLISGTDPIEGWVKDRDGLYRAPMSWDLGRGFNQVFSNGQPLVEARFPNLKSGDLLDPDLFPVGITGTRANSVRLLQRKNHWKDAIFVGGIGNRWTFQCAVVLDSRPGSLRLGSGSSPWFEGEGEGYLTGTIMALDDPREWHYEDGYIYAVTELQGIEAKRRPWCIDFNLKHDIVVKGLDVFAGSIRLAGYRNVVEECNISYPSHFTYFSWSGYSANGGAIDGHNGILIQGRENVIRNSSVLWSAGSGIVIQGTGNLVEHTVIENIDYSGTYSCPVAFIDAGPGSGGNTVRFCTIRDTGRDGIQMYGARSENILYNDISRTGRLCLDTGFLYVWGTDGRQTQIAYNWLHDNVSAGINPGVYLDNYCRNFIVHHNVIWNCEAAVRINGPASGHVIINNTCFSSDPIGSHSYKVWPPPAGAIANAWPRNEYEYVDANNLYLQSFPGHTLVDPGNNNFSLKENGSGGIDGGTQIDGFHDNYSGDAPDLGAYEFGMPYWRPGVSGPTGEGDTSRR